MSIEYLAGLCDGEACFSLTKTGAFRIALGMSSDKILKKIQEDFGGHVIGPYQKKAGKKPMWDWNIYGLEAYILIRQLIPFLIEKKDQAECMQEYWQNVKGNKERVKGKEEEKEFFYQKISMLKH